MPLQPINLLMLWTSSAETDPGHIWLRRQILSLVAELDGATGPERSSDPSCTSTWHDAVAELARSRRSDSQDRGVPSAIDGKAYAGWYYDNSYVHNYCSLLH
jgi:hypothetical protein